MGFTPIDPDFENRKKQAETKAVRDEIIQEIISELYKKFLSAHLTPSQIIIDDEMLQQILMISKRKTSLLREKRIISYSQENPNAKVYYTLQDAIDYINNHRIESFHSQKKKNKK
jgi:hypothetical protein